MFVELQNYAAAHRYLVDIVRRETAMTDPVAFAPGGWEWYLLKVARKRQAVPVDGVLIPDWNTGSRKGSSGLRLGIRLYEIEGVTFATVQFYLDFNTESAAHHFWVVDRSQYLKLYKIARRLFRTQEQRSEPPVLSADQSETLWQNTIGFLEGEQLERIRNYGGRCQRGVLLTGPPGNGKTMACRWIWEECCRRSWEYRMVTPNSYQQARGSCDPENAVRSLFNVHRRGIIFFDDMDLALRDRQQAGDSDDQAVFLTALDGITTKEGVVYVFTTNCQLDLIDRAFKRPGRIDVVLELDPPGPELRRELFGRWHADIRAHIDLEGAIEHTDGYSFAEIEELRNLLIMRFAESEQWDWEWAVQHFAANRDGLSRRNGMGFFPMPAEAGNGHGPF